MALKINGILVAKEDVAEGVRKFTFKTGGDFPYAAGQFAFFEFRSGNTDHSKPFSMANRPGTGEIEIATVMSGSPYKTALDAMALQGGIGIRGPWGNFTLDSLKKDSVCFMVGGIGITPVRSMLQHIEKSRGSVKRVVLLYSNRTPARTAFMEELERIASSVEGMTVVNTVTDLAEGEKASFRGRTGRIDRQMVTEYVKEPAGFQFYIVGPPRFSDAMKGMLSSEMGVEPGAVTMENFAGY